MSTRRRSRSKSRDKKSATSKLRMDTKPVTPRITDPSLPAGRRREIDNVMKKARAQTSPTSASIWDKKLLEVEAKDPNRWRHSGYKSLYVDGRSVSRSRSRSRSFTRARSPRSPLPRRSPIRGRSPRSPPMRARSPRSPRGARSPRSPPPRPRSPPPRRRSPRSPPPSSPASRRRCRSISNSSVSSCSDDSCSMCSPKNRRQRSRSRSYSPPPPRRRNVRISPSPKRPRGRPPSPTSPPPRRMARPQTPPGGPPPGGLASDRPTDPRRRPPPPPPRASSGKVIDVKGVRPNAKPGPAGSKAKPPLLTRIKKEGKVSIKKKKRPGSAGGDSSGSEDSTTSIVVPIVATTGLTLSERFGKIAQWSADRERRDIENMRITKTGSNMKVMVEEDEFLYGSPSRSLSPSGGLFPESLLSASQSRLEAWDDIRVRYQYYKDLGYLRDLTLEDYVKWEDWWYKYQDWLASEHHYERWLETQSSSSSGRRRRKKRSAD